MDEPMHSFETIKYEITDSIAVVTLNRPQKHNALNLKMLFELQDAISQAKEDKEVRVVVIRGAGQKSFSAGIDLGDGLFEDAKNLTDTMQKSLLPLIELIHHIDKPVVASVNGVAIGLGASIALQCDLMIMSDVASLHIMFSKLGIVPDGGACWQLVHRLGYNRAMQIALESTTLDAQKCFEVGIANKVVCAGDLDDETMNWAAKLARNSPVSQGLTKQLMRKVLDGASNLGISALETKAQSVCADSDYCKQAYTAFLNK